MTVYADIADHDEDTRISIIASQVIAHHQTVGFIVEDDEKADRYISKLNERYPEVEVWARGRGPTPGTVMVKVGPRRH